MRIRRSVIALAVLTLVLMPRDGKSQGSAAGDKQKKPVATLGQNYPNPYNPDTHIPFTVGGYPECTDLSKRYRVTVRIFNVLAQPVAVPELRGSSGGVAGGQKLQNAQLPCGSYVGFWDGKYAKNGKEVASGVYIYTLEVDGVRLLSKSSTVAK